MIEKLFQVWFGDKKFRETGVKLGELFCQAGLKMMRAIWVVYSKPRCLRKAMTGGSKKLLMTTHKVSAGNAEYVTSQLKTDQRGG